MKLSKILRITGLVAAVFHIFLGLGIGLLLAEDSKYWVFFIENGYDAYVGLFGMTAICFGLINGLMHCFICMACADLHERHCEGASFSDDILQNEAEQTQPSEPVKVNVINKADLLTKVNEPEKKDTWICEVCGFENKAEDEYCKNCIAELENKDK